jgi:hypothetical protein
MFRVNLITFYCCFYTLKFRVQDATVMIGFLKPIVSEFDIAQIPSLIIKLFGMSSAVDTDLCEHVI